MPELPEVEVIRKYFEEAVLHVKIAGLEFLDDKNTIFKSNRKELSENLTGNSFTETRRIGKYLFVQISNGNWLHLHFGMTGSLEIYNDDHSLPRFTRFAIHFDNGSRLAFIDSRKFGVIQIIDDMEAYRAKGHLGKDLLEIKPKEFVAALKNRNTAIKPALLDQKHFAGIGNWIADEMLFETGIHPEEPCKNLSEKELTALLKSAVRIVKTAIEKDTHYGDFPKNFFFNYRRKNAIHPDHPHSKVQKLKVGGRGTFIVPEKQKRKS